MSRLCSQVGRSGTGAAQLWPVPFCGSKRERPGEDKQEASRGEPRWILGRWREGGEVVRRRVSQRDLGELVSQKGRLQLGEALFAPR